MVTMPPDSKYQLIRKDSDARKECGQEEKGATKDETDMTEDEMIGWHHRLNGLELEQVPGDGEGREAWRTAVRGVTESRA